MLSLFVSILMVYSGFADLNFLAVGDWGMDTTAQTNAAKGMDAVASQINASFVVLLGDNFYNQGIRGDRKKRFKATFDDVYNGEALSNISFYAIAGNHDHLGDVMEQIKHTSSEDNINERWNYPDWWYFKIFDVPGTTKTLEIIFFDTEIGLGEEEELSKIQWSWLKERIELSTADYLWVAGHYPIWSACMHGRTADLLKFLKPHLEKYNANYMNGHDHCMGHIVHENTNYITNGLGSHCCYDVNIKNAPSKDAVKFWIGGKGGSGHQEMKYKIHSGFTSIKVSNEDMRITFHSSDGAELYTSDPIPPREVQSPKQKFENNDGKISGLSAMPDRFENTLKRYRKSITTLANVPSNKRKLKAAVMLTRLVQQMERQLVELDGLIEDWEEEKRQGIVKLSLFNRRKHEVEIFWMTTDKKARSIGIISTNGVGMITSSHGKRIVVKKMDGTFVQDIHIDFNEGSEQIAVISGVVNAGVKATKDDL